MRRHPSWGSVVWPPSTYGSATITWTGESCGCGRTRGNLVVGCVQTVFEYVAMGRRVATRRKGPLVKARPCKVKGLDPVVKRYRVRRDGSPGCSNATGASHRALIHAVRYGGMSEEAARVSGVWPPSRTAPPPAPGGGKRMHRSLILYEYKTFQCVRK